MPRIDMFSIEASAAVLAAVLAMSLAPGVHAQDQRTAALTQRAPSSTAALPNFAPLVERYGPAVVNVDVVQTRQQQAMPQEQLEPFSEFFRRFGMPGPQFAPPPGSRPPTRGAGSGFIISPDGYVFTNSHVVANADEITVRLTDRREFRAEVVGTDPYTDVALLKIDARNLPTVTIGNPNELKPGQWVVAIGSPFGLENTATAGIVSATSRAVASDSPVPFIQTDVAVNPGNSGGPLFNLSGEVVGINSMIFSRTGGYMGLSFAIPIDVATNVRDQLLKTGRVVRGRIGVTIQEVTAQLAQSFGLERARGALVSSVEEGGPADRAGLESGDVILGIGGREIERNVELSRAIASMQPGAKTQLEIWRDGKRRTVDVRIGEMQATAGMAGQGSGQAGSVEEAKLGLQVRPLAPADQQRVGTEGAIVVEQATGPAARAGLLPGDVILGIGGERVESIDELRRAAQKLDQNDSIALLVERDGAQIFIPIRVG